MTFYVVLLLLKGLNYDNSSLQDGFDTKYMSQVGVAYDGTVTWMPPALFQSSCEGNWKFEFEKVKNTYSVDMLYFPFDTQVCNLKFGSWSYWKSLLNIQHTYPTNELKASESTSLVN